MDRVKYLVTLETRSPVILSSRPSNDDSSTYQTMDYITGASVRGAFIQLLKDSGHFQDELAITNEIKEKFMEGGYRFGNFHISNSLQLPLTAVSCKQFSGFKNEDEKNHGVKDSLLLYFKNQTDFDPESLQCKHGSENSGICQGSLTSFDKPVKPVRDSYELSSPLMKIQTGHISIDPITQTNQKGQLFFENAIEIGERFQGFIEVPADQKENFEKIFHEGTSIRVGSKRTSGFGLVTVRDVSPTERILPSGNRSLRQDVQTRWENFQKVCKELGILKEGEKAFTVTFMSNAILKDSWFRYRSDLTKDLIEQYSGLRFSIL